MKKMMIALVAVAFAAIAQAASVDWGISLVGGGAGRIYDNTGSTIWSNNTGATAYFMLSSMVEDFVAAVNNNSSLDGLYLDSSTNFKSTTGAMNANQTATDTKITTAAQDFKTVLLYTDSTGDTYYKVSTSVASMERVQVTDPAQVAFASNSTIVSQEWTKAGAIPEPTSALMLLVGLAGLALKRKIA